MSIKVNPLAKFDVLAVHALADLWVDVISTSSDLFVQSYRAAYGLQAIESLARTALNLIAFIFYSLANIVSSSYELNRAISWSHTSLSAHCIWIALWGTLISPKGAAKKTLDDLLTPIYNKTKSAFPVFCRWQDRSIRLMMELAQ